MRRISCQWKILLPGPIIFWGDYKDYYWKIDYYDRNLEFHSPDPADPAVTVRVLTVMRVDEY